MRVSVSGGRAYRVTNEDAESLIRLLARLGVDDCSVGDCPTGVDAWFRDWCASGDLEVFVFEAQWDLFGRGAGPRRNAVMMESADALIAFPGGRKTASCIREARRLGRPVYDIRSGEPLS